MDSEHLVELFELVRENRLSVTQAVARLRHMPFEDLGFAKIDHHRALRQGFPEVIMGQGKDAKDIAAIVRATRAAPVLTLGASPRGSVALLKMAQAAALLDGRAYVVPDDVKSLAPAVLRHRVAVAPELELEGVTADTALHGIIEKIEAPR